MIETRGKVKTLRMSLLAALFVIGISSATEAGPLGVNIDPFPDILAGMITSTYNATTGAFTATGYALSLDTGTGAQNITTNFKVQATIDNAGVASGGVLTIGTSTSPVLKSLQLLGFAFNAVQGGAMEFLFGSLTGSYVPAIYAADKPLDVMLSAGNGFLGSFKTSFTSSSGTAEIRPDPPPPGDGTPEPSALLLMVVAAMGLSLGVYANRRRSTAAFWQ